MNGGLIVLRVRLQLLKKAIESRRLRDIEWAFDRVSRAVDKLERQDDKWAGVRNYYQKPREAALIDDAQLETDPREETDRGTPIVGLDTDDPGVDPSW